MKEEQSKNEKQSMNVINLIDLVILQNLIVVLQETETRSIYMK